MIEYLHDDQYTNDNIAVFRFLCREWTIYFATMHTRTTMDAIKRKLLEMKVRYINRAPDGTWSYWTKYDDIMEFSPYETAITDIETDRLDQAELTGMSSPTDKLPDTTEETADKYLIQPPEPPSPTEATPEKDFTVSHEIDRRHMDEQTALTPVMQEHASPTSAAPTASVQDRPSDTILAPYTKTADAEPTEDRGYSSDASLSSHMDSMLDEDDQDPFIPVPMRGRYKKSKYQFLQMPNSKSPVDLTESPDTKFPKTTRKSESLTSPLPSTRYDTSAALPEASQMSTFSELLNDRIVEMMAKVDNREQSILAKMDEREDSLRKM